MWWYHASVHEMKIKICNLLKTENKHLKWIHLIFRWTLPIFFFLSLRQNMAKWLRCPGLSSLCNSAVLSSHNTGVRVFLQHTQLNSPKDLGRNDTNFLKRTIWKGSYDYTVLVNYKLINKTLHDTLVRMFKC